MNDPSTQEIGGVLAAVAADPELGLTAGEARRRLLQDGPNELRAKPRLSRWRRALKHFQDPLIYLLLAAVGIALLAWAIEGRQGWPVDAIVIGVVVLVNGVLGFAQEAKAASSTTHAKAASLPLVWTTTTF